MKRRSSGLVRNVARRSHVAGLATPVGLRGLAIRPRLARAVMIASPRPWRPRPWIRRRATATADLAVVNQSVPAAPRTRHPIVAWGNDTPISRLARPDPQKPRHAPTVVGASLSCLAAQARRSASGPHEAAVCRIPAAAGHARSRRCRRRLWRSYAGTPRQCQRRD